MKSIVRTFFFTLILLFFFPHLINSQDYVKDEEIHNRAIKFSNTNLDSMLFYSKKMQKSKNLYRRLTGRVYEATVYYKKSDYGLSRNIVLNVLDSTNMKIPNGQKFRYSKTLVGKNYNDCLTIVKINAYRRLFFISRNEDKYELSLGHLKRFRGALEDLSVKDNYYLRNKIESAQYLALIFNELGLYQISKKILLKIKNSISEIQLKKNNPFFFNFKKQKINMYNSLADTYIRINKVEFEKKNIDSANYFYGKATELGNEIPNYKSYSDLINELKKVDFLIATRKFESALSYIYEKQEKIDGKNHYNLNVNYAKSVCFVKMKQYDSCLIYSKRFYNTIPKNKLRFVSNLIKVLDNMTISYRKTQELDSAVKYSNILTNKIEYLAKERLKCLNKVTQDNTLTIRNNSIRTVSTAPKKTVKAYYIAIFLCLLFLAIYFIYKNKASVKRNRIIDKDIVALIISKLNEIENRKLFLRNDFNQRFLADYIGTNISYLSEIINKHKKVSFKQYLFSLRMEYLIDKLKNTKDFDKFSIEAIGKEIGYTNASSFTRAFKNYKGVNPSEFIQKLKK